MNTIELRIAPPRGRSKHLRFSGPSQWAELTDHQAVALTRLRMSVQERPETLFVALRLLYGLKSRHQRWLFDERFLRARGFGADTIEQVLEQGQLLLDSLTWIGNDPAATFPRRFRRYDHHYGTPLMGVKRLLNRTVYAGPGDALGDCTFEEFMFADKAYADGNLPLLAAILCRPLVGSRRESFDRAGVEARAALFADLDPALLQRIAFGFSNTQQRLQRAFRFIFPKKLTSDSSNSEKTDKQAGSKSAGNWLDVAIGMAKLDVTKIRQIEQINLYLALKVLNEQLRQAEEMDTRIAKMKDK